MVKLMRLFRTKYRLHEGTGLSSECYSQDVEAHTSMEAAQKLRKYIDRHDPFFMGLEAQSIEVVDEFLR